MTVPRDTPANMSAHERRHMDADQELKRMLYAVSHDVRAPLRALDGFALALEEDYASKLDANGVDYLRRIRTGAKRMERMLETITRLSKLTQHPLTLGHADLSHMTHDILSGLRESGGPRQTELIVDSGLELETDRALLRVAMQELLSNAWKFTSETPRATIHVQRGKTHRGSFTFSVRDNGAGFDAAGADGRLFGLFQRFHPPDRFPGEGCGLAVALRAIRLLGGTIAAESRPGEGATFHCEIPTHERHR